MLTFVSEPLSIIIPASSVLAGFPDLPESISKSGSTVVICVCASKLPVATLLPVTVSVVPSNVRFASSVKSPVPFPVRILFAPIVASPVPP